MATKTAKKPARSRVNAAPSPEEEVGYTQRFKPIDHAWFTALAARDRRSLNSWVVAACLKAATVQDPNYLLHPKPKKAG